MPYKHSKSLAAGLAVVALAIFGMYATSKPVSAASGDMKVTVTREAGFGNIGSGALVEVRCVGAVGNLFYELGTTDGDGIIRENTPPVSANCDDGDGVDVRVSKNGYVTKTVLGAFQYFVAGSLNLDCGSDGETPCNTDPDDGSLYNHATISDVQFAVKVTAIKEASLGALDGAIVKVGTAFGTSCAESASTGIYYCVLPIETGGTSLSINKPGYVEFSNAVNQYTGRVSNASPQSVVSRTLSYGHKVLTSVSGATVTGNSGAVACDASGATYYCPIPKGAGDSTITVTASGFNDVTANSARRNDDTDSQVELNILSQTNFDYTGEGFDNYGIFPLAVTVEDELGNDLDEASPTFNGNTYTARDGNIYYWAATGTHALVVVNDGYVTDATQSELEVDGVIQVTYTSTLKFAYKITEVRNEVINQSIAVTTLELGSTEARNACTLFEGAWYCPVLLGNSPEGQSVRAHVAADGYVERTDYSTSLEGRNEGADSQIVGLFGGIQFAYKLSTFTAEATNADLKTLVTAVAVGDSDGQTYCAEGTDGNADVWFCAVPLSQSDDSNINLYATIDGYVAEDNVVTGNTRSVHTEIQRTPGVLGIKYAYKVTGVKDELGNTLSTVDVDSNTGNSWDIQCSEVSGDWYCPVLINSGWGGGSGNFTYVAAQKDGYVSQSFNTNSLRTAHSDAQISVNFDNDTTNDGGNGAAASQALKFGHKVTVKREADAANVNGATVSVGGTECVQRTGDDTAKAGEYFCATPLANDDDDGEEDDNGGNGDGGPTGLYVSIAKTGYETDDSSLEVSDRIQHTGSQKTYVLEGDDALKFQLKVIVADQLGNAINISDLDEISFGDGDVQNDPAYQSENVAYFAIDTGDGTGILEIQKDGYVDSRTGNTKFGNVETGSTNDQTVITMGNYPFRTLTNITNGNNGTAKGLRFAQIVTVQRTGDLAKLDNAVVKAGINPNLSGGVLCGRPDGAGTGVYYCVVPLENQNEKTLVAAPTYKTEQINFTKRSSVTDGQVGLVAYLSGQGDNDSTTPTVFSQYPDGGMGLPVSIHPVVTFSGPMNSGTLNSQTIQLLKAVYGEGIHGVQVQATILYNSSTNSVTISPHAPLDYESAYWIHVTGALDTAGNMVATYNDKNYGDFLQSETDAPEGWFMTEESTADQTRPTVAVDDEEEALVSPANSASSVSVYVQPSVTFSEPMSPGSFSGTHISLWTYVENEAEARVPADILMVNGGTKAVIVPHEPLDYETTYLIEILNTVTDLAGNTMVSNYHSLFTTGASGADTTDPLVDGFSPAADAENISIYVEPTVTFSEAIKQEFFSSQYMGVYYHDGEDVFVPSTVQGFISNGKWTAKIIPSVPLEYDTEYFLWVSSLVEDLAGNQILDGENNWSSENFGGGFTTVAEPTGALEVNGISSVANPNNNIGFAEAGGGYNGGFAWLFNVTLPNAHDGVRMKFSDFVSGSGSIAAANNIRYCSTASPDMDCSADNKWVQISATNTYASWLYLPTDLNSGLPGRQTQIKVQMRVPLNTPGGAYSASYGIETEELED